MNLNTKILLLFHKKAEEHLVCKDYVSISFDSATGRYFIVEDSKAKIREYFRPDYEMLNKWLNEKDMHFLELEQYVLCAFPSYLIESFCESIWDFSIMIQKHIMLGTEFSKALLQIDSLQAIKLLYSTEATITEQRSKPSSTLYNNRFLKKRTLDTRELGNRHKSLEIKNENKKQTEKSNVALPPISEIVSKIQNSIIGQDDAVKKVVYAIYSNLNLIHKNLTLSEIVALKNNVLLSGPSGSGKTEIARQLSDKFHIPVVIEDIKQYSGTGWKGNEITELLKKLYLRSDNKLEIAERSILFLDEIDKIAVTEDSHSHNTLEVQQGLLKLMEGGVYTIDVSLGKQVSFDTKYLTLR